MEHKCVPALVSRELRSLAFVAIISRSFKWRARVGDEIGVHVCLFCLDFDLPFLPMLKLRALFPLLFCGTKGVVLVFFDLCSTGCCLLVGAVSRETLMWVILRGGPKLHLL